MNVEFILLLPLIVSIIAFFLPNKIIKEYGLSFSGVFFLLSVALLTKFDAGKEINFTFYKNWLLSDVGGSINLGADGISLLMIILTNFAVFYVNLMAWDKKYSSSFYGLVFLMQFALIGVFTSLNALLFYFFWELALIPIYFIVYKWGKGLDIGKTFIRFFIYTFVGSLFILTAFILFYTETGISSFDLRIMAPRTLEGIPLMLFSLFLVIGFGVKIPIFPLHSWQADTYRKSPAEGTVLLSGIMLKMGLYGLYRWFVPFQIHANSQLQTIFIILCIAGVLYGGFIALRRNDLKLIAAFSSLSHVGLIAAGLFSLTFSGFQGGIIQMLVHGINIIGLFYIIDIIESATGTRDLNELGGLSSKQPIFAVFVFIIILGSIAVPLTNGFPGEMLLLFSLFQKNAILGGVAGLTIIIGAAYMLRLFQRAFMGEMSEKVASAKPIATIHLVALAFISILVIAIGVYPQYIMDLTANESQYLINLLELNK